MNISGGNAAGAGTDPLAESHFTTEVSGHEHGRTEHSLPHTEQHQSSSALT